MKNRISPNTLERLGPGLSGFLRWRRANTQYAMECLDRGLEAVRNDSGNLFLSWGYSVTARGLLVTSAFGDIERLNELALAPLRRVPIISGFRKSLCIMQRHRSSINR